YIVKAPFEARDHTGIGSATVHRRWTHNHWLGQSTPSGRGESLRGSLVRGPAWALGRLHDHGAGQHMGTLVTTEVAVAYTHCPRKAFLLLNTAAPPPPHEYEAFCRA